ncbi:arsenic transporter [Helicobacter sp. 12S02232-10]|uniref:arsenical efflux pump membrane protein ArsB n=1 Tax=Helicobacter sp. 12S02232-10 TaxID=1476197 RepID=UPI000BA551EC|nr:arsenical efflux pump membrane protein ArsB [Helicobacter sp. 12S02232-10]PAF46890.1 arsenic transporter [Helicobacter sp. 12S02232-10]
MLLSATIFFLTLTGIIFRPLGIGFGSIAIFGAIFSLIFGTVDLNDIYSIFHIVWNATFTLIGLIILSLTLDTIGFFECIALWIAKNSSSNPMRLFVFILLFGAILSGIFANDGAVLILTPIVFALMQYFQAKNTLLIAFLLGIGFISDTASSPLVTSNLTNILTAGFFKISFTDYAKTMFIPNLIAIITSILVLCAYFYKTLQTPFELAPLPSPKNVLKSVGLFVFSWIFLGLLFIGLILGDAYHLPASLFVLGGALIFLFISKKYGGIQAIKILKNAPWQVVGLSVGMYVVVYGLKNAGITHYLSEISLYLQSQGNLIANLGVGLIAAAFSSLMNNMPANLIQNIALKDAGLNHLAYSNIIGSNLGTKFTPIGSLATLLWLYVLNKKGIKISWLQYCKTGLIITPPVLFATLLAKVYL